jgi:hypothetical protein
MGEEVRRDDDAVHGAAVDNLPEFHGVPEDDDGGEQVHAGDAIMLPFAGSVPDFTSAVEADGALEGMMGLALVETDLSLALEAGIEIQSIMNRVRSMRPTSRNARASSFWRG